MRCGSSAIEDKTILKLRLFLYHMALWHYELCSEKAWPPLLLPEKKEHHITRAIGGSSHSTRELGREHGLSTLRLFSLIPCGYFGILVFILLSICPACSMRGRTLLPLSLSPQTENPLVRVYACSINCECCTRPVNTWLLPPSIIIFASLCTLEYRCHANAKQLGY